MDKYNYFIPAKKVRTELKISNSKFITTIVPVNSVDDAKNFILEMRSEFSDASHNVPAYIVGFGSSSIEHCSDDGEPSGTAGRPALTVLKGSGFGDIAVVVSRYFGGAKLGRGGLVRAYTQAVKECITRLPLAKRELVTVLVLSVPYPLFEMVQVLIESQLAEISDREFGADVFLTVYVPTDKVAQLTEKIRDLSSGKCEPVKIEDKEIIRRV